MLTYTRLVRDFGLPLLRIRRFLSTDSNATRCTLENVQLFSPFGQFTDSLHGRDSGTQNADLLAPKASQLRMGIFGRAPRDVVVPTGGVEHVPSEIIQTSNLGYFRVVQRPTAEVEELGIRRKGQRLVKSQRVRFKVGPEE